MTKIVFGSLKKVRTGGKGVLVFVEHKALLLIDETLFIPLYFGSENFKLLNQTPSWVKVLTKFGLAEMHSITIEENSIDVK